jgi:hypothetical protein
VEVSRNLSSNELARLIPALNDHLPAILSEVREHFRSDWPDYAEYLAHEQGEVTAAVRAFLTSLVEVAEQPGGAAGDGDSPHIALFEGIGRLQFQENRELSSLLAAYQVGGRVAWRHVSRAALALGVEPAALAGLAEAVFIFVDQLSSASARGYVWEQSEAVAERERRREELVDLLLSGRSDLGAVRTAAVRAGWSLPSEAAVILIDSTNPIGQTFLSRLDSTCLPVRRRNVVGAIVPDPDGPGRRGRLAQALRGARAVVGHPVALEHLPVSVDIAETAAELQRTGVLEDDPVFADEHLDAILVHRDPRLLAALRRRMLAPLDGQSAGTRDRLIETLTSWLRHFGDRRAMAAELHVHPQTVRYRMGQLATLFGSTLDSPEERARLMLALAWSRRGRAEGDDPAAAAGMPGRVTNRPAAVASITGRAGRVSRVATPAGASASMGPGAVGSSAGTGSSTAVGSSAPASPSPALNASAPVASSAALNSPAAVGSLAPVRPSAADEPTTPVAPIASAVERAPRSGSPEAQASRAARAANSTAGRSSGRHQTRT